MPPMILPPAEYHQLDVEPPRRSFARGLVFALPFAVLLWGLLL